MERSRISRARTPVLTAVALAAVVGVAACGSSHNAASANNTSSSSTSNAPAVAGSITIKTANGPDGAYLTDGAGRALYMWVADKNGTSTCYGTCAAAWPPLTQKPAAAGGALAEDLGQTARKDGTMQVTYDGHPLYYYAGDNSAGAINGQGSNGFGAKWWIVAPSGSAITATSSASPTMPNGYGY